MLELAGAMDDPSRSPSSPDPQAHPPHGHHNGKSSGNPIAVREMVLEDLPKVFALGERLFTAEKWPNLHRTWDEYEVIELFATDGETCLVAEMDDEVVGFALGTLIEKRRSAWTYGYLLWLGVAPEVVRRGVASRLVTRMRDLFIDEGARMILVDTDAENHQAVTFFKQQGFGNETAHVYLEQNLTSHPAYAKRRAKRHLGVTRSHPKPKPAAVDAGET